MKATRIAVAVSAAVCLGWSAGPTWAVPKPMSPEELEGASDLVATVHVLGVVCTGYVQDNVTHSRLAQYQAWLRMLEVKKGMVKNGETVIVRWREIPAGLLGAWRVAYYPGEEVVTHFRWSADDRAYVSTWWNAKGRATKAAESGELSKDCP